MKKIETVKAILIGKHANNQQSDNQAIASLLRMKYAVSRKTSSPIRYYLEFMTKKGRRKYQVQAKDYQFIKIDSLGELSTEKNQFHSFVFHKIATKKDVEDLGW